MNIGKYKIKLRQGNILSCKRFMTVVEYAFKQLDWNRKDININGEYLNHLQFIDDELEYYPDNR